MCDPGTLILASAVVSAAGTAYSGLMASSNASMQAKIAGQNKGYEREAAQDAIERGQEEQRLLGRDVAARVGSQTARMAANNVDVTTGSAARTIEDTEMLGREDAEIIAENTRRAVRSRQISASNYEMEARARKSEANSAKIGTMFAVANTAMGGATQYAKFKQGRSG